MISERNFFTRNVDVTWKNFVRETCDDSQVSSEEKEYCLRFQGNEAKEAYEEIIKQKGNINFQFDRYSRCKQRIQNHSALKTVLSVEKGKESRIVDEKVTINNILRAIEQKDMKFLVKHVTQENVNSTDNFGWTPLMLAAYHGHLDITEFLLHLGANKEAREKSGLTAAQLALKKNFLNIVALIKRNTVRSNVSSRNVYINSMEPLKNFEIVCESINNINEQLKNNTKFYCEICKLIFHQTTWEKHETSVLHIFNTKPKLSNAIYGIPKQNKGYQMLLNVGWDEQHGLGPLGKGTKYPVKTCLKTDRKGFDRLNEKEYRVTHFKPGDTAAVDDLKTSKQKCLKKKDRERLLHREVRKERALRIALS